MYLKGLLHGRKGKGRKKKGKMENSGYFRGQTVYKHVAVRRSADFFANLFINFIHGPAWKWCPYDAFWNAKRMVEKGRGTGREPVPPLLDESYDPELTCWWSRLQWVAPAGFFSTFLSRSTEAIICSRVITFSKRMDVEEAMYSNV